MSGVEACLHRFFDDVLNRRDRTAAGELLAQSFTDHDPVLAGDADAAGLLAASTHCTRPCRTAATSRCS